MPHPRHIACNSGGAVRVAVWLLLPTAVRPSQVDMLCVKLSRGTPIDFANFCEKGIDSIEGRIKGSYRVASYRARLEKGLAADEARHSLEHCLGKRQFAFM